MTGSQPLQADNVVAADLDGDGTADLGTVSDGVLSIAGKSVKLEGSFQRAVRMPRPGGDALVVATGQGRGHREAATRIIEVTQGETRTLWTHKGARNQVTDLRVVDGRLWIAAYSDARKVSGGWLTDGTLEPLATAHMGQRQLPLDDGRVVVARVYGEAPKSPGDLSLYSPGGATVPLTSLRGARALAAVDLDGDGVDEVISGDGWHYAYGAEADPRVVVHSGPDLSQARVIAWIPESYAALDIVPINQGKDAALLVQGSQRAVVLQRDALGWATLDLGAISEVSDMAVLDSGSDTVLRVAISGEGARVVTLELGR